MKFRIQMVMAMVHSLVSLLFARAPDIVYASTNVSSVVFATVFFFHPMEVSSIFDIREHTYLIRGCSKYYDVKPTPDTHTKKKENWIEMNIHESKKTI